MKTAILRAHAALAVVETLGAFLAGLIVMVIMVLGIWEVIGRSAFSTPLHGYLDMVEQMMVAVALLGVAYCQSHLGNVRMTLFIGRLSGRFRWTLEAIAFAAALLVIVVLIKGSWAHFYRAFSIGGTSPEIQLPLWWASLVVPIALTILAARLLLQLLEAIRLIGKPGDTTQLLAYHDHVPDVDDDPRMGE
ncbi:MAG: TRAP transporter small permease subunit [Flavobacteriaceae bacterium]